MSPDKTPTHHKQYGEDHVDWVRRQRPQSVHGHERLITYGERGCHGFVRPWPWRHRGWSIQRARRGGTATVRRRIPAYRQLLLERLDAGTLLGQQFLLVLAGRQLLLERLVAGTLLGQVGSGLLGPFSDFRFRL